MRLPAILDFDFDTGISGTDFIRNNFYLLSIQVISEKQGHELVIVKIHLLEELQTSL